MFYSVLFPTEESYRLPRRKEAPESFRDLNIDKILKPVIQEQPELELEEFFYTPLPDPAVIRYRQDVMKELMDPGKRFAIESMVGQITFLRMFMDSLRMKLTTDGKFTGKYLDMGHLLENASLFSNVVAGLAQGIQHIELQSEGLRQFRAYMAEYSASAKFKEMQEWAARLRANVDKERYCLHIKDNLVRVAPYEGQEDYADRVGELFARFRQGDVMDYRRKLKEEPLSENLENKILEMVAHYYPAEFKDLTAFCQEYLHFDDDTLMRFSREIQFYFHWLDFLEPLRQAGLPFCFPVIHEKLDDVKALDCFDLALAMDKADKIVTNSFTLTAPEQILIVSGPNQGGKTTFARSFGQIHVLSSLGVMVPGREADIFLCDQVLTHFEREEDLVNLSGKLQDDLVRLHALLEAATHKTVIIINEIFASTTLVDALQLGGHMLDAIVEKGAPAMVVTFLEELVDYGPQTVSMVTTVTNDEKHRRTFRLLRQAPDGQAFAMQIAAQHGLTFEQLDRRLKA